MINVQVEALDLSSLSSSSATAATLPSDISCLVTVALTSSEPFHTKKYSWTSRREYLPFFRSEPGSSLFLAPRRPSDFVLRLDPLRTLKESGFVNQYPSNLQLKITVTHPSLDEMKAQYDFARDGEFVLEGGSDVGDGRGAGRDRIKVNWTTGNGEAHLEHGRIATTGMAKGILETALRSIEKSSRREAAEEHLVRPCLPPAFHDGSQVCCTRPGASP